MPQSTRRYASVLFAAYLALSAVTARAAADIVITTPTPNVHLQPGESSSVMIRIANFGPDAADVTVSDRLGSFNDFVFSAPSEADCGVWTDETEGTDKAYSLHVGMMTAGAAIDCTIGVARGTGDFSTFDAYASWYSLGDDDPNPSNSAVLLALGSLTDVSLALKLETFSIDPEGVAHATETLSAVNLGPTSIEPFEVGACLDTQSPPFEINGDFPGGCGPLMGRAVFEASEPDLVCFESRIVFDLPALATGESSSCEIQLTGLAVYDGPTSFTFTATDFINADLGDGFLIDTNPVNNQIALLAEPLDQLFYGAFDR